MKERDTKVNIWKSTRIRRASFTVESAYIVPLLAVFITFLLGYTYFTHQQNWCKGAAYESLYYGLQRSAEGNAPEAEASARLSDRIAERPLDLSEISSDVQENAGALNAESSTQILPETFGERFAAEQNVSVRKIEPAVLKRTEWLIKYALEQGK